MTLVGLLSLVLLQFPIAALLLLLMLALSTLGGQPSYLLGILLSAPVLATFLLPSSILPLLPKTLGTKQLSQVLGILAVAALLSSELFRELVGQLLLVKVHTEVSVGMLLVVAGGVALSAAALAGAVVASIVLLATVPMQWLAGGARKAPLAQGWFFEVLRLWILGAVIYGISALLLEFVVAWTKPALILTAP